MEKILIVDDSALEIKVLADILKERYEILLAKSGEEGIECARREGPVLILLDIIMPGRNGFETLEILKNDEKIMNIPVIFLTALEDEKTEEKGLMMGAVDYIKKPYNPNIVQQRVENQIKMYQYRRTIESQMAMDGLTNVYNRSDFERKKREFWERAGKDGMSLSFFIVDIDYFKNVNDTYGHAVGDTVLSRVAEAMRNVVREGENHYIARYGGEEFVVMLYGEGRNQAQAAAESVRAAVEGLKIPNEKSKICPMVTVSIGGNTVIPMGYGDMEEFIRKADDMLYQAKENGRNQIMWMEG